MKQGFFNSLFKGSVEDNYSVIRKLYKSVSKNTRSVLDLGCDDGSLTRSIFKNKRLFGVDLTKNALKKANKKINVVMADLNKRFPFKANSFDLVHSNQVIEHLIDVDLFVKEIHRITKKGGYVITSTENLSSLHNIIAILLGKQAFSQHISKEFFIGNSLSHNYMKKMAPKTWTHNKIFSYDGLKDIFRINGFIDLKILGAGYYPLSGSLSRFFAKIDPKHSAFITLIARKA